MAKDPINVKLAIKHPKRDSSIFTNKINASFLVLKAIALTNKEILATRKRFR